MFPRPIEQTSSGTQAIYKTMLPVALFVWLLPLIAIFMTSIRPAEDINKGNMFTFDNKLILEGEQLPGARVLGRPPA